MIRIRKHISSSLKIMWPRVWRRSLFLRADAKYHGASMVLAHDEAIFASWLSETCLKLAYCNEVPA